MLKSRGGVVRPHSIEIHLARLIRAGFLGIVGLTIASFSVSFCYLQFATAWGESLPGKVLSRLTRLLNVSLEHNIPTWYQTIALLLCALVLSAIAYIQQKESSPWTRRWWGLSWIFYFLSLDEAAQLHEQLVIPARALLQNPTGFLYYGWMVPASAIVLLFGVKYFHFWHALPTSTKRLFGLAAGVYLAGALGAEMIGGYLDERLGGVETVPYLIASTLEEFLEMTGTWIFLYALLLYAETHIGTVDVTIENLNPKQPDL